jgi:hypothetical protein
VNVATSRRPRAAWQMSRGPGAWLIVGASLGGGYFARLRATAAGVAPGVHAGCARAPRAPHDASLSAALPASAALLPRPPGARCPRRGLRNVTLCANVLASLGHGKVGASGWPRAAAGPGPAWPHQKLTEWAHLASKFE